MDPILAAEPPVGAQTSRSRRLALIAALYCTQNLSLGFFVYAFLTIAQGRGVPLAAIGTASGIAIILTMKFLWAPLIDRFGSDRLGHYRGWLLLTQGTLGLGIAALALFDPGADFGVLLVLFAVMFFVAGTQDIAADATATRLLQPEERGIGNGFQSAGAAVAQVVGGGLVLVIYEFAGWQVAALTLAAFSLIPLPLILAWQEESSTSDQPTPHITVTSVLGFFRNSSVRWWCLALIPAYTFGFTMAYNLVRPILIEAGWSEGRIGTIVVIAGSGVGIAAGIGAGFVVSKIGRRAALMWLGILQVLATFGVLPMALGYTSQWIVLAVVGLANAAFCAAFAVVYTISMDLARPQSAGTDFTFFTTVGGILMVVAGGGAMVSASVFGFVSTILAAGVLSLFGLVFTVWKIDRALEGDATR